MSKIQLILQTQLTPELTVTVNGSAVNSTVIIDAYQNQQVIFDYDLEEKNSITLNVHTTGAANLTEIIVDGIRFGLVTFLCTTVNGTQNTQITAPGEIAIELQAPVWKFWCDKLTEFNYERYPLGSIT